MKRFLQSVLQAGVIRRGGSILCLTASFIFSSNLIVCVGVGEKMVLAKSCYCACVYIWRFLMSENCHPVNVSLASKSFF